MEFVIHPCFREALQYDCLFESRGNQAAQVPVLLAPEAHLLEMRSFHLDGCFSQKGFKHRGVGVRVKDILAEALYVKTDC